MNIQKMQAYVDSVYNLRAARDIAAMMGDYKTFKQTKIVHATESLVNFDLAKKIPYPKISVPIFSKYGFNMIKIAILDLFRKKTPDERKMAKLLEKEKLERKFFDKTV